ncbi:MAG: FHA domain-containing protein [Deltaproteobacteria bacterium]|nr:FHA domain-containing protein [Deltaproteobacteria bacterium]
MAKYRLQYQAVDIKLGIGEFFVGRESICNLVLDDALVSRKHAVFRVVGNIVEVEDLDSRNGVRVNGAKIDGPTQLKHGDRISIGSHELLLKDISVQEQSAKTKDLRTMHTVEFAGTCRKCSEPIAYGTEQCPNCGEVLFPSASQQVAENNEKIRPVSEIEEEKTISSIALLTGIADKALSMGRYDEADRILSGVLNEILERAKKKRILDNDEHNKAAEYSLLLIEATYKPQWLDYLFQLYEATRRLMPAETIDSLYRIVNALRYANPAPIRAYLHELKKIANAYNATERFLFTRLQGLEQLISSK